MTWTQDKTFLPQHPVPYQKTVPYPQLDGHMSADQMAQILSALVFTSSRDWRRPVYLTPRARNTIVAALLAWRNGRPIT